MAKVKVKDPLAEALKTFEKSTNSPIDYLKEQKDHAKRNQSLTKTLFDYAKSAGSHFQSNSLPDELYIEQLDEEQIWQQIEMQNDSFWDKCMTETCRLLSFNDGKLQMSIECEGQANEEADECEDENQSNDESDNLQENESDEEIEEESEAEESENGDGDGDGDGDDDSDSGTENLGLDVPSKEKKTSNSMVDDQFFKFSEMEAFLDSEDKKELDRLNGKKKRSKDDDESSDSEIDYFDSLSDGDENDEEETNGQAGPMYADFFDTENQRTETREQMIKRKRSERDAKNKRKEHEMNEDLGIDSANDSDAEEEEEEEEEIEEESDDDNVEKSEFDLRQDRLQKRIQQLEEDALGEKPWQLKGEITSSTRPKNSLLEEVLEFDSTARPPPLITEETTLCLEDIIKRRIKSKAWDDVERKIKPINDNQDFRKNLVLQQEKSKESLAQIYEKDYLEKVHKLNNVDDISKPDEPPEHTEIRKAMKDLFIKLDALSNFHFTAKPIAAEAKIITNIPAIEMEEVAPVAVSDATLLAPEEVRQRPVGDEIGKLERTSTDKKRERRKKKLNQKLKKQKMDKRIQEKEKLGIKVTTKEKQQQLLKQVTKSRNVIKGKNTDEAENWALKSSQNFFSKLQDNVTSAVKSKSSKRNKSASDQQESSAKRFKL